MPRQQRSPHWVLMRILSCLQYKLVLNLAQAYHLNLMVVLWILSTNKLGHCNQETWDRSDNTGDGSMIHA